MKKILFLMILVLTFSVYGKTRFTRIFFNQHEFTVELAETDSQKAIGLMFRKSIPEDFGMLFLYSDEDYRAMWMKNTLIPLDLVFINSQKEIVDIIQEVPPCKKDPCESYISKEKARFVLELNSGTAKKIELKIGDRIFFILE